jgi:hypothetical protein
MRTGRDRVADQILNAPGVQPPPPATACDYLSLLSELQLVIDDLHRQEQQQQPAAAEPSPHHGCMSLLHGCNLVMLHLVSEVWEVPQSRPSPQQQQAACADALLVQALAVPLELDAFSAYVAEIGNSWRPGHQLHALRAAFLLTWAWCHHLLVSWEGVLVGKWRGIVTDCGCSCLVNAMSQWRMHCVY